MRTHTHTHSIALECNDQRSCLLFEFYSLSIQYGKKKIKHINYEKQHLYFYLGESPWNHFLYHPLSLKQAIVKPDGMTAVFSQRDQPMSSCDWEKQHILFQASWGTTRKRKSK